MTHLQGGKVDMSLVQNAARENLLRLLEKCPGKKAIVWDSELAGPMGLIAKYSLLQECDVLKMYSLGPGALPDTDLDHIIFITRPKPYLMQWIADNVHEEKKSAAKPNKKYHVFFVPYKTSLCESALKNRKMYGSLTLVEDFRCLLFPYDSDLVTFELPDAFREYQLEEDPTCLYQAAQAIVELQRLFGPVARAWGKGTAAHQTWQLVKRLVREREACGEDAAASETRAAAGRPCIDQLLILDRAVDLVSPLATQLTYEGLIDEIYGVAHSTAQFPGDMFAGSADEALPRAAVTRRAVILNSADRFFAELRDKNFRAVGPVLSRQARLISAQLEPRTDERSVQEMKQLVQRLPELLADKKALAMHTTIAEHIKRATDADDFLEDLQAEQEFLNCMDVERANARVEDLLAAQAPLHRVLRLVCLQCLAGSGLKPKLLEYYVRELVQVYGVQTLLPLANLERAGLLRPQAGVRPYAVLRKALHLTTEDTSETCPTDVSYVHSGYAPLSVRLAEQLTRAGGWRDFQDVLGLLPGPTLDDVPPGAPPVPDAPDGPTVILVLFIGGCTFAEVSALRFLSQQDDSNVEFVVATTSIINSKTFLTNLMKPIV